MRIKVNVTAADNNHELIQLFLSRGHTIDRRVAWVRRHEHLSFLQSLTLWKKVVMWFVCVPLVPISSLVYIVTPHSKVPEQPR